MRSRPARDSAVLRRGLPPDEYDRATRAHVLPPAPASHVDDGSLRALCEALVRVGDGDFSARATGEFAVLHPAVAATLHGAVENLRDTVAQLSAAGQEVADAARRLRECPDVSASASHLDRLSAHAEAILALTRRFQVQPATN